MILKISVTTQSEQSIRLIVRDFEQQNTELTNRSVVVNGNFDFYIRMPLCREYVDIVLYNEADPSNNSSFKYNGYKKQHLQTRLNVIDFSKYNLKEYIRFIQKFCYNAGVLETNSLTNPDHLYRSENFIFFIRYLPYIRDYETGQEVDTPCRIDVETSLIEVSQKHFLRYSVPGRISALFHEFSHPHENENPDDEVEADLHGLILYLGLGYPRLEAENTWCEILNEVPSEENIQRIEYIRKIISDFDDPKMKMFFFN